MLVQAIKRFMKPDGLDCVKGDKVEVPENRGLRLIKDKYAVPCEATQAAAEEQKNKGGRPTKEQQAMKNAAV